MGELEPEDSRNVTGMTTTPDGRWTGGARHAPTPTGAKGEGRVESGQSAKVTERDAARQEPLTSEDAQDPTTRAQVRADRKTEDDVSDSPKARDGWNSKT